MTQPALRRIRHVRRWLGYGAMILLICVALLVGIANRMLPWVQQHPEQIAAWLSDRVGEPVTFTRAYAEWTRRGPLFTLDGLRVGRGEKVLDIGRAELQVAVYSGLLPGAPLTELKVRELSLQLVQGDDKRWRFIGLPGHQKQNHDPLDTLEGFGELQIEKARLRILAPRHKLDTVLPRIDLRLRVYSDRVLAGVSAWAVAKGQPLDAVFDLQRDGSRGRLWAGGKDAVLPDWSPLLAATGLRIKEGHGQLGVWASLLDRRIVSVQVAADLQALDLQSSDALTYADGRKAPAEARFERVQADALWRTDATGWRLDAPVLHFQQASRQQPYSLDGIGMLWGPRFALRAPTIDAAPLAALLSLRGELPPALRAWLAQAQPDATLSDFALDGVRGGFWQGRAKLRDVAVLPVGNSPGFSGLGGALRFDRDGGVMAIAPGTFHFDWPVGFRQPLDVQMQGTLALWRNGAGWTVGATHARVRGDGFGADFRGELGFQGDGSHPTLDLATRVDTATLQTAKKFWIMHKMPASAVQWLDTALQSGRVENGRLVVGGDLDDWPFRHGEGRFDARGQIRDAQLKFNPDWPAAEQFNADVDFFGPGFAVEGRSQLLGNPIERVSGGIADFHTPWLTIDAASKSRGENLRQLMIASPLNKDYGEHLKAAVIAGDAQVAVQLKLPLQHQLGEKSVEGTLDLSNGRLTDPRWNVDFTQVSGRTRFSDHGFAAENLHVLLEDQPGEFGLKVGDFTGDAKSAVTASLSGRFTPQSLLKSHDSLAWLKPWLAGTSRWQIGLRVPKSAPGQKAPPSSLQVSSDLVGTAITMPAPLAKDAAAPLMLTVETAIPIEQGEISVRLGSLLRMRGRAAADGAINGLVQFGETPMSTVPTSPGLVVRGSTPSLDAAGWIGFAGQGEGAGKIRDVDLQVSALTLFDRPFADSHLQMQRSDASTHLRLQGNGIDGSVEIPSDLAHGVQGHFAQLHLPGPDVAGTAAASPVPAVEEDPAKLPPLHFNIDDLRLGPAQLGRAEMQSAPIKGGLRVEKFQTRSQSISLDASGDWLRVDEHSRSNFRIDFKADSLGKMLDALGFAGMVQGGKTTATLTGNWPGSPGAFSLANIDGKLHAEVGEGRLLEVDPGGSGRILGLISLAEIPRRLTLDFSDFFAKGFSFNTVNGDFVFVDGKASTDNLHINGPSAEIRVSGSTGLRDQDYDQRVEVLPKAGGVLPALGMLAGGPAGAAIGAVAQAVLQKPLKQTTRVVYRVTGPWKDPKVVVVEKGPPKGGPATTGPAVKSDADRHPDSP